MEALRTVGLARRDDFYWTLHSVLVKRRANARRMTLRVSQANGEITLTLPERADFAAGRAFAAPADLTPRGRRLTIVA